MTYEEITEGMEVEYEDFWHSNILSWKKGVVEFITRCNVVTKVVRFENKKAIIIFPHRMYLVREAKNRK